MTTSCASELLTRLVPVIALTRNVETVLAPGFPGSWLEAPVSTAVRNVLDNADVVDLPTSVVP
jgi:hypothetical protein